MKLLPKVSQRNVFSKITFKTLSAMPHSQNSWCAVWFDTQNIKIFVNDCEAEIKFLPNR